jgi:DNA-directed RNA polymerase subunit beta'
MGDSGFGSKIGERLLLDEDDLIADEINDLVIEDDDDFGEEEEDDDDDDDFDDE